MHGALIIVDRITVIALFFALNGAVTTLCGSAINTSIYTAINAAFTRVTSLPWLHNPVTAPGQRTGVTAGIIIDRITIITSFIRLNKTITASGVTAKRRTRSSRAI